MRLLLATLVVLLAAAPADAQFRRSPKFAEKGDLALVVELGGLDVFELQPALSGVGARYRVADRTVLGGSLGLSLSEQSSESSGTQNGGDQDQSGTNVRLATWVEQHVGVRSRFVSPFVGAGVQFGIADQSSDRVQTVDLGNGETATVTDEISSEGFTVGGGLLLGAEIRIARGVTVGGAYTLGIEYGSSEDVRRRTGPTIDPQVERFDRSSFRAGTGVTGLVFSVYF